MDFYNLTSPQPRAGGRPGGAGAGAGAGARAFRSGRRRRSGAGKSGVREGGSEPSERTNERTGERRRTTPRGGPGPGGAGGRGGGTRRSLQTRARASLPGAAPLEPPPGRPARSRPRRSSRPPRSLAPSLAARPGPDSHSQHSRGAAAGGRGRALGGGQQRAPQVGRAAPPPGWLPTRSVWSRDVLFPGDRTPPLLQGWLFGVTEARARVTLLFQVKLLGGRDSPDPDTLLSAQDSLSR